MKTGNTLRTAKNSLLCFFMALAGGFLVACGSSSDGVAVPSSPSVTISPQPSLAAVDFSSYLFDTAAEGVEYSGPTGNGVTGEGGVFLASDGVFEFSIGDTNLGRVSLNSEWADNAVTPADFMGVDDAQVITIARIMQALDEDNTLQNGISISQATRDDSEGVSTLYSRVGTSNEAIAGNSVGDNNQQYTIPSVANAMNHLVDTRKCLFSGGYVGGYSTALRGDVVPDPAEGGTVYYAIELFAPDNHAKRFGFDASGTVSALQSFDANSNVGVTASFISDGLGNTLSFITPRLAMGEWEDRSDTASTVSGTHTALVAVGNPGATRRIVGVQTTDDTGDTAAGMYVLDYFANDNEDNGGSFSGQYYDVSAGTVVLASPLTLTIAADGGSWSSVAMDGSVAMLILIGTRGESDMTITMRIARVDENYGTFSDGSVPSDASLLSGTWCDIGGAVGSIDAPTPPRPSIEVTVTWNEVSGATVYKLYRSTASDGTVTVSGDIPSSVTLYVDRPSAGPEYSYEVEACNSAGCSERPSDPPAAGGGDGGDGNGGDGNGGDGNGGDGNGGDGNGGDGNGGAPPDDGQCREGQILMLGESCEWEGITFETFLGGSATYGSLTGFTGIFARGLFVAEKVNEAGVNSDDGDRWIIRELGTR